MDIDHFKAINDTHGHSCGHAVLQAVATALRLGSGPAMPWCGWGGEGLLVICQYDKDPETAHGLGKRLRQTVEQLHSEALPPVTISIGVALRAPAEAWGAQLERAEAALDRAKRSGRSQGELA